MTTELYTVILDYAGGSYISQIEASNVIDSFDSWLKNLDYHTIWNFGKASYAYICSEWQSKTCNIV